MPTGLFLVPMERVEGRGYRRRCAMDQLTPQILADRGDWTEGEVNGAGTLGQGHAVVKVRASGKTLDDIKLLFQEITESQAINLCSEAVKVAAYDQKTDRLIFRSDRNIVTKTFTKLSSGVKETPPSDEQVKLLSRWLAVGFGLGWRIPYQAAEWLASRGHYPDMWKTIVARMLYGDTSLWPFLTVPFLWKVAGPNSLFSLAPLAFPTNTAVLDNFDGSDANPIGGNWTTPFFGGDGALQRVGNQCAGSNTSGAWNSAYLNNANYGPDCEMQFKVATLPLNGEGCEGAVRGQNPNSSGIDNYFLHLSKVSGTDTLHIYRTLDSTQTQQGASVNQEVAAGDFLGIDAVGSSISGYYKAAAGSWAQSLTRTEGTITAAGRIALVIQNGTTRLDDLLGGTVVAGGTTFFQSISGDLSFAGALSKRTNKVFVGGVSFSGGIQKQANKVLSGSLSFSGALAAIKTALQSISGALSFSGASIGRAGKALSGSLSFAGGLAKQARKALSGAISFSGALARAKVALLSLSGAVGFSGSLSRIAGKAIGGNLSFSGAIARRCTKLLSGSLSFSGSVSRRVEKILSGALSFAGGLVAIKNNIIVKITKILEIISFFRREKNIDSTFQRDNEKDGFF